MEIVKLRSIPTGNVRVRFDNAGTTLVSYTTDVVQIDRNGWLKCYGTYSQTTRKHISKFMKEYTSYNYYDAKECYENNLALNIYTGVRISLADYNTLQ